MTTANDFTAISDALVALTQKLFGPPDTDLAALRAAVARYPGEDAPRLMLIDRLEELGATSAAQMERFRLTLMQCQRDMMNAVIASLSVPAHLLSGGGK